MREPDEVWKTSQVLGHSPFGTAISGRWAIARLVATSGRSAVVPTAGALQQPGSVPGDPDTASVPA